MAHKKCRHKSHGWSMETGNMEETISKYRNKSHRNNTQCI